MKRAFFEAAARGWLLRFALIAPVICAAATPAHRDHGAWRSSVFGGGGFVQNVVPAPSDPRVLYSYVDVGGLYRSDDGGRSWRMRHGGLPAVEGAYSIRGLSVSPREPDDLVVAAGNQWAGRHGVFRSRDGGLTWTKVLDAQFFGNEAQRAAGLVLTRDAAGSLFAGAAGDGLFRSEDDGATWTKIGLEGLFITDVKFADDGRGWVCAQAWTAADGRAFAGGFFATEDGGATWSRRGDSLPAEIALAPDGALVGLFDAAQARRSEDGGRTWEDFSQGLPVKPEASKGYTSEHRFQALAAGPEFLLIGSARGTIYRRDAGGEAWRRVERVAVREEVEGTPWWGRLEPGKWPHFGASMGSLVVMPGEPRRWFFTDWYGIYETTDAGREWTLRIDGVEVTVIHAVAGDPSDSAVVHVAMADNGYARSLDGGERFETGKPTSNMKMLSISPALPSRIYATGDGDAEWRASRVWVSADRGATWHRSPMRGLPAPARHSINTLLAHPTRPYELLVAVSGRVGEGGGVYRSVDGGASFEPLNEGLEEAGALFRHEIWSVGPELALDAGGRMVLASHERNAIYAHDGARWRPVKLEAAGKPQDLIAAGDRFFLSRREGGLWRSTDGGFNWERVFEERTFAPAADPRDARRVAAATVAGLRISRDGGESWELLPLPPHGLVSGLAFAGDRLVAGTRGGGLFWMPLGEAGQTPRAAGLAGPGWLPVAESARMRAPQIPDPAFVQAETVQRRWTSPWIGAGRCELEWFATTPGDGALRLRSVDGAANGSTGLVFPAVENSFRVRLRWRVTMAPSAPAGGKAQLALRSRGAGGAQLDWKPLVLTTVSTGSWVEAEQIVTLAPGATQGEFVLVLNGDLVAELDELSVDLPPPLFGTPVMSGASAAANVGVRFPSSP